MQYFTYFIINAFFISVATQRPNYREDYRYEKAFNAFYKVHHGSAAWSEARIRCEAEGTELLVPASLDEADAMILLVASILKAHEGVFIGIHDLYSERTFVTLNGNLIQGSILNILWEHREPRYGGGRCLAMRRTGRFFLHPCSEHLPFICKKNAAGITYYQECDTFDSRWKLGPNGNCYLIHVEPQTWYQAYLTCLGAGGQLLVINDKLEAKHVRDMFKNVSEARVPNNNFAFLGYSDLFQRHHYRTIYGQRLRDTGFTDWDFKCVKADETINSHRCGGLRRSGLLITGDCDIPAMFFCEKTISPKTALRDIPKQSHQQQVKMVEEDYLFGDVL